MGTCCTLSHKGNHHPDSVCSCVAVRASYSRANLVEDPCELFNGLSKGLVSCDFLAFFFGGCDMLLVMPRQALPYIGKLANGLRG